MIHFDFQDVLQYLVEQLEKKDTQRFFANPVTDAIAPGYSSIITQPMDFSRMKEKIVQKEYTSIPQMTVCINNIFYLLIYLSEVLYNIHK